MKCSGVHCNLLPSNDVIELFGNIKTQFFLSKKT